MTLTLHPDWKEFLRLLIRHGARFLVVGGHAVAANGRPRFTEDLDVFVEPSLANARRVGKAVTALGFPGYGRECIQLAEPDKMMFLGRKPVRIDILSSISGVSFREAWKGRLVAATDIGDVPVLGLQQLRRNKAASGRPKDLFDIALLDEGATPVASHSRSKRRPRAAPRSRTPGKADRKRRR